MLMKNREPSRLEMQVLSVLWQRGASSVREVLAVMPDGKARAYTTILSVMQVMEKKGSSPMSPRAMSTFTRRGCRAKK